MLQTEAKSEFFSNDREIHHFNDVGKELYLGKHDVHMLLSVYHKSCVEFVNKWFNWKLWDIDIVITVPSIIKSYILGNKQFQ